MPKFKVREGYAYYKTTVAAAIKAGGIVELDNITDGDQQWKLEQINEAPVASKVETAPAPVSTQKDEVPKKGKKFSLFGEKAESAPVATPEVVAEAPTEAPAQTTAEPQE